MHRSKLAKFNKGSLQYGVSRLAAESSAIFFRGATTWGGGVPKFFRGFSLEGLLYFISQRIYCAFLTRKNKLQKKNALL